MKYWRSVPGSTSDAIFDLHILKQVYGCGLRVFFMRIWFRRLEEIYRIHHWKRRSVYRDSPLQTCWIRQSISERRNHRFIYIHQPTAAAVVYILSETPVKIYSYLRPWIAWYWLHTENGIDDQKYRAAGSNPDPPSLDISFSRCHSTGKFADPVNCGVNVHIM